MHMPGHKRNTKLCGIGDPYAIDITEIEGFDNLHQPEGVLLSLADRMSRIYGALSSYPLVNGSTAGILTGISAAIRRGDKVLVARNSHKAVYHGVILTGAVPVYCYPQNIGDMALFGGILPEEIEEALINNPGIRLVVVTSPTYEGVVSDIRAIADLAHKYGAYLLVDEAHGAHFGFHEAFPVSAVKLGADLVIQSLHKTLPALTQSAVLHCNAKELLPRIRKNLAIYQSSSPSYVLMAGMDQCIRLLEENAEPLFEEYNQRLRQFYREMQTLRALRILNQDIKGEYGIYDLDRSKLTISVAGTGITGHDLHSLLRHKYQLMFEMEAPEYVLGMTSICDTKEGFDRLTKALLEIDEALSGSIVQEAKEYHKPDRPVDLKQDNNLPSPNIRLAPWEAWGRDTEEMDFHTSAGQVSAAFISLFPPGAPVLVPGEVITEELIKYILSVKDAGICVNGLGGEDKNRIAVVIMEQGK